MSINNYRHIFFNHAEKFLCKRIRKINTSVRTIVLINLPSEGTSPGGIMEAYTTIKCGLVFGFYILFTIVLPLPPIFAYTIALLLTFLCNFPLAYFAWKIKNKNNYKKK